jgi:hypothetical protein
MRIWFALHEWVTPSFAANQPGLLQTNRAKKPGLLQTNRANQPGLLQTNRAKKPGLLPRKAVPLRNHDSQKYPNFGGEMLFPLSPWGRELPISGPLPI